MSSTAESHSADWVAEVQLGLIEAHEHQIEEARNMIGWERCIDLVIEALTGPDGKDRDRAKAILREIATWMDAEYDGGNFGGPLATASLRMI